MKIETRDGKLVVAEHYSGLDALKEERGFAASTAALGVFIFVASMGVLLAFGIPATTVFSWATLQPFVVTSALFGAIAVIGLLWAAVAAPFDCGFEFVFDTTSKICSYKRILHLRRWNIDLRGPAENLAFAQISGVGVREFCDEGSYLYQPVLLVGARTIPLASRRCSYL